MSGAECLDNELALRDLHTLRHMLHKCCYMLLSVAICCSS